MGLCTALTDAFYAVMIADGCAFTVAAVSEAVKAVCQFSHQLSDTIVFGFATSHTASIEAGEGVYMCLFLIFYILSFVWH